VKLRSLGGRNDWRGGYGGAREQRWELTEHRHHEERDAERERGRGRTIRKEGKEERRRGGETEV